jgi:hypothetical protein
MIKNIIRTTVLSHYCLRNFFAYLFQVKLRNDGQGNSNSLFKSCINPEIFIDLEYGLNRKDYKNGQEILLPIRHFQEKVMYYFKLYDLKLNKNTITAPLAQILVSPVLSPPRNV